MCALKRSKTKGLSIKNIKKCMSFTIDVDVFARMDGLLRDINNLNKSKSKFLTRTKLVEIGISNNLHKMAFADDLIETENETVNKKYRKTLNISPSPEVNKEIREYAEEKRIKMSPLVCAVLRKMISISQRCINLIQSCIVGEQDGKYFIDLDKLQVLEEKGFINFQTRKKIGQCSQIFNIDNRSIILIKYEDICLTMLNNIKMS